MGRKQGRFGLSNQLFRLPGGIIWRGHRLRIGVTSDGRMERRSPLEVSTQTMTSSPTDRELEELLALATNLALEAGQIHERREMGVAETKSSITDPVTAVDKEAEEFISQEIRKARPNDGIIGEEDTSVAGSSGLRWVIDPLDGTVNYLYEYPSYAVSIGIERDGSPLVGVVYDSVLGLLYAARAGAPATRNGKPISVTNCPNLPEALLGTGFSYQPLIRAEQALRVAKLLPRVRDIRRSGSCAVDLCSVAAGHLDAFYETDVNWWDVAAGIQIVRSAGGIATYEPQSKRIIASGSQLWDQLNQAIFE